MVWFVVASRVDLKGFTMVKTCMYENKSLRTVYLFTKDNTAHAWLTAKFTTGLKKVWTRNGAQVRMTASRGFQFTLSAQCYISYLTAVITVFHTKCCTLAFRHIPYNFEIRWPYFLIFIYSEGFLTRLIFSYSKLRILKKETQF